VFRQAVLIQDVLSFREYIRPYLEPIFEPYGYQGFRLEKVIGFILRELIWQNTQCIVAAHDSNAWGYRAMFDQLQTAMQKPTLDGVFQHLLRVPKIYGDAELFVALDGRDLTILYFIPQPLRFI
jgi:hypothetical protein